VIVVIAKDLGLMEHLDFRADQSPFQRCKFALRNDALAVLPCLPPQKDANNARSALAPISCYHGSKWI
jgi:hypothetical protein